MTTLDPPIPVDHPGAGEFPFRAFPTGWFQVAWSGEVERGDVRPLRYFGRDLVLYRTTAGEAVVLDAFCPHRGAHIGYGGRVVGDDVLCPNHGWVFDARGRNVGRPGGEPALDHCGLNRWAVREWSGAIFVWHDAGGGPATWEPVRLAAADDPHRFYPAYPEGIGMTQVAFGPHIVIENMADMAHVKYVHKWNDVPRLDEWREDGHHLRTVFSGSIPTPKGPVDLLLYNAAYGMGLITASFNGFRQTEQLLCVTPVDEHATDVRVSIWVERGPDSSDGPDNLARSIYAAQVSEILDPVSGADRTIWDHVRYIAHPPLAKEEARIVGRCRRWMRQFYPY